MKPVCVSTWGDSRKYFTSFIETAKRNGIDPVNADPEVWPGTDWKDIEWLRKSQAQAKFVREHLDKFTHFMFVDSYDVVFATGWEEILDKYERIDSPIVFAAECCPWPLAEQAYMYPHTPNRTKFLNAGGWIATADAAMALLTDIETAAAKRDQCDQGIAVDAFLSQKHPIVLDTACSLWFCCNLDSLNYLDLSGRPRTTDTMQYPCMFHGNGGSSLHGIIDALNKHPRWTPTEEENARMAE